MLKKLTCMLITLVMVLNIAVSGGIAFTASAAGTNETIRPNDSRVVLSSGWNVEGSGSIWGNTPGSTVTFTFTGTGLELYGTHDTTHGMAEIKLDGVSEIFDGYGASIGEELLWSVSGLENCEHTFVFTVLNEKNPSSSNYFHDVVYFIVENYGGSITPTSAPSATNPPSPTTAPSTGGSETIRPNDSRVVLSSGWNVEGSGSIWGNTPGSTVTFTFTGTGLELYGTHDTTHGMAEIKLDGVSEIFDGYGASIGEELLWSVSGLENCEHTFVFTVLNEKNPSSSNYFHDVVYFIIKTPGEETPVYGDWPQPDEVVNIIFDTDMGADCDDAGSAAMLATYAQRGKVNILAMMCSIGNKYGAPCIDAINTYYDLPDIPVGTLKGMDNFHADDTLSYNKYIAENYSNDTYSGLSAPDAVELYRKTLAAQPDNSVVIICTGSQINLYNLLLSGADKYSNLTGKQLVQQKVKLLSCMGGKFPNGTEWNIQQSPAAAKYVAENWNTPIMYSGYEIGNEFFPGTRRNEMDSDNPVRIAYDRFTGSTYNGREGWDLSAVLYAVEGLGDYWSMKRGTVTIGTSGQNSFTENSTGNHAYLVKKMNPTQLCSVIDTLFVGATKATNTDAYKLSFTDTNNQPIYKLDSNTNKVNVNLIYKNTKNKAEVYTVYVGVYDENRMLVEVGMYQNNLQINQTGNFPIELNLDPSADKSKYTLSVFVWVADSLEPMHKVFNLQ